MGAGIVQLGAQSCHRVSACDASVEALERAQVYVREGLWRFAEKGAFYEDEGVSHYNRIHWTTNIEKLSDAPAVIEAIFEKVEPPREAFAALDDLLPPDSPIITNTSNALGKRDQANYVVAKAGIQVFIKTLAIELGRYGLTANAVAPGLTETEMAPEDVAAAILYFASEEASLVSGQVLYFAGWPRA